MFSCLLWNDLPSNIQTPTCEPRTDQAALETPTALRGSSLQATLLTLQTRTLFLLPETNFVLAVSDSLLPALLTAAEGRTGAVTSLGSSAATMSFIHGWIYLFIYFFFRGLLAGFSCHPLGAKASWLARGASIFAPKQSGRVAGRAEPSPPALLGIMLSKAPHLWHFSFCNPHKEKKVRVLVFLAQPSYSNNHN